MYETGTVIVIQDAGINKPVFDGETLQDIYSLEFLVMLAFILLRFFQRTLSQKYKKNIFLKNKI